MSSEAVVDLDQRARISAATLFLAAATTAFVVVHLIAAFFVFQQVAAGRQISDWVSFYSGASIVHAGGQARLYDLGFQDLTQANMFGGRADLNPYVLPAFVAVAFSPVAELSFPASYFVWLAFNVTALAGLALLAWRYLEDATIKGRALIVALTTLSIPAVSVLLLGQMEFVLLAGLIACFFLLNRGRPFAAGAALALALVKPYVIIPAVALLLFHRQWRALAGFLLVATVLLLAVPMLIGPHLVFDQVLVMRSDQSDLTSQSVNEQMMVNLRGLITSLGRTDAAWAWAPPLLLVALVACKQALRVWSRTAPNDPQAWALALVLPIIVSPHAHVQSVVLVLAAAILYVRASIRSGLTLAPEWGLTAFVAMTAAWLLSIAGVNVMALLVLAAFALFSLRWPPDQARSGSDELVARGRPAMSEGPVDRVHATEAA